MGQRRAAVFPARSFRGVPVPGAARLAALLLAAALAAVLTLTAACSLGDESTQAPPGNASGGELSTVDVVRELTPSVVHVFTEPVATGAFNQPSPGAGVGTGIILQPDGYVLTSNHVIAGAESITITLHNGESYFGRLVGWGRRP